MCTCRGITVCVFYYCYANNIFVGTFIFCQYLVFVVFQPLTIKYTDCLIIVHIQRNHDNKLLPVSVFFQAFIIFYLQ